MRIAEFQIIRVDVFRWIFHPLTRPYIASHACTPTREQAARCSVVLVSVLQHHTHIDAFFLAIDLEFAKTCLPIQSRPLSWLISQPSAIIFTTLR